MSVLGGISTTEDIGASNAVIPTGVLAAFAGTLPDPSAGWLPCDGTEWARATYTALDTLIGTSFGAYTNGSGGAGSTHFRTPNLTGRAPAGKKGGGVAFAGSGGTLNHAHAVGSLTVPDHYHGAGDFRVGTHTHTSSYSMANHNHVFADVRDTRIIDTGTTQLEAYYGIYDGTVDDYILLNHFQYFGNAAPAVSGTVDANGTYYLANSTGSVVESRTAGGSLQAAETAYGQVIWAIKT